MQSNKALSDLLHGLLQKHPSVRPTMEQVLERPLLATYVAIFGSSPPSRAPAMLPSPLGVGGVLDGPVGDLTRVIADRLPAAPCPASPGSPGTRARWDRPSRARASASAATGRDVAPSPSPLGLPVDPSGPDASGQHGGHRAPWEQQMHAWREKDKAKQQSRAGSATVLQPPMPPPMQRMMQQPVAGRRVSGGGGRAPVPLDQRPAWNDIVAILEATIDATSVGAGMSAVPPTAGVDVVPMNAALHHVAASLSPPRVSPRVARAPPTAAPASHPFMLTRRPETHAGRPAGLLGAGAVLGNLCSAPPPRGAEAEALEALELKETLRARGQDSTRNGLHANASWDGDGIGEGGVRMPRARWAAPAPVALSAVQDEGTGLTTDHAAVPKWRPGGPLGAAAIVFAEAKAAAQRNARAVPPLPFTAAGDTMVDDDLAPAPPLYHIQHHHHHHHHPDVLRQASVGHGRRAGEHAEGALGQAAARQAFLDSRQAARRNAHQVVALEQQSDYDRLGAVIDTRPLSRAQQHQQHQPPLQQHQPVSLKSDPAAARQHHEADLAAARAAAYAESRAAALKNAKQVADLQSSAGPAGNAFDALRAAAADAGDAGPSHAERVRQQKQARLDQARADHEAALAAERRRTHAERQRLHDLMSAADPQ